MKKIPWWILVTAVLAVFCNRGGEESPEEKLPGRFSGKVIALADGDSFVMLVNGNEVRVRMHGIDAPERHQAFSTKSKRFLASLIFGKKVEVDKVDIDRYGRVVGEVYVNGKHVNAEMVKHGYAWHFKYYSHDPDLARWEDSARARHLGLWRDPHPMPPWEWRRLKREGLLDDMQTPQPVE